MSPVAPALTPADLAERIRDQLFQHEMSPRELAWALLPARASEAQKRNKLRLVRRWISPTSPRVPSRVHADRMAEYFGVDAATFTLARDDGHVTATLASLETRLLQGLADLREQLADLQARVQHLEAGQARRAPRGGPR